MPTVAELERLQALVTRLVPLAAAAPRTLIRSEDWNLVVGALIELSRAVLAEDKTRLVGAHDHADQVQLSWLDARLRSLLEKGPLADPASLARINELDRRIGQTTSLLDGVRGGVADIRARVDDVTTRDLIRQADVTKVRRSVEALGDSRADVLGLRESLEALREDLQVAIKVGRQLEVGGRPLDVPAFVARIDALEVLRKHLTLPDGQPLDATALERRLTELTNTLVTEEELDEALRNHHPELSAELAARLKEDILGAADTRISSAVAGQRTELGVTIDSRLADVEAKVAGAVRSALPGVRDQVLDAARGEIAEAVGAGTTDQQVFTERRLAEQSKLLTRDLSARIDEVEAGVAPAVGAEVGRQLGARLPELQDQLAALGKRADGLDTRAAAAQSGLAEHTKLLSGLESGLGELSTRLDQQISAVLDKADANAAQLVEAATERLRGQLTSLAGKLVEERVASAINDIRGEIREIARDEIGAVLPEIDKRTARILDTQLPDRILAIFKADFEQRGPLFQLIQRRGVSLAGPGVLATEQPAAPGTPKKRTPRKNPP